MCQTDNQLPPVPTAEGLRALTIDGLLDYFEESSRVFQALPCGGPFGRVESRFGDIADAYRGELKRRLNPTTGLPPWVEVDNTVGKGAGNIGLSISGHTGHVRLYAEGQIEVRSR